jgi:hypothetical protein|uniref:Uncharacterized protein n=1 Tax=Picea sitchensis TaxID=3332 RepID=A0A6B9XVS9_PICSI|nr:hypothetical protein Q903MT_gene4109 [Picea sitchensis]
MYQKSEQGQVVGQHQQNKLDQHQPRQNQQSQKMKGMRGMCKKAPQGRDAARKEASVRIGSTWATGSTGTG